MAELRALTVRQPYCSAITSGDKRRENRTWPTRYRGLVALHAAKAVEWDAPDIAWTAARLTPWRPGLRRDAWIGCLDLGVVTAVAELTGCHHAGDCITGALDAYSFCTPWSMPAAYHWEIENVRPLAVPVPCRGALGLWRLPADAEKAVREQLEET